MIIESRKFDKPDGHHTGWFKVFLGSRIVEIWTGKRFTIIDWSK